MTLTEKVAYLKGLADGMKLDTDKNEGKLISEMIKVLEEVALSVSDLEAETVRLNDYAEELDEDLGDVEEYVFGDDECDCCDCCEEDDEAEDDEDGDDYDEDDDFDVDDVVEVVCPFCGETICVPPQVDFAHLICPACNEEFSYIEDEKDDISDGE